MNSITFVVSIVSVGMLIWILIYEFHYRDLKKINDEQKDNQHHDNPYNKNEKQKSHWQNMIPPYISVVAMLTKIAKSDGAISPKEATKIEEIITSSVDTIAKQSTLTTVEQKELRKQFVQAHKSAKVDNASISTYALYLSNQEFSEKREILTQLISMAIIDGYNDKKESLVYEAGRSFGFSDLHIKSLIDEIVPRQKQESHTNKFEPYSVLGCNSSDSNEAIKKQYRILIKKYHPDFIQSKGLDESFIEFAKQKLQEINQSYEAIKKKRGI